MTTNRTSFLRLTSCFPLGALLMAVVCWGIWQGTNDANRTWRVGTDAQIMQIREHAEGSPAGVLALHGADCWRGAQKAKAKVPGAAILQMKSGEAVYTKRPALVSSAFNEVLGSMGYGDHDDARFVVVALCI